jgi:hypothetical protein
VMAPIPRDRMALAMFGDTGQHAIAPLGPALIVVHPVSSVK